MSARYLRGRATTLRKVFFFAPSIASHASLLPLFHFGSGHSTPVRWGVRWGEVCEVTLSTRIPKPIRRRWNPGEISWWHLHWRIVFNALLSVLVDEWLINWLIDWYENVFIRPIIISTLLAFKSSEEDELQLVHIFATTSSHHSLGGHRQVA